MEIVDKNIDSGVPFDWGKVSLDYAKFRDIYPKEFYQKIIDRKLCLDGQSILDIGTGTGVLPRNMNMGQSGRGQIYQKTKLNKLSFFPKVWI